jgi:hypothetical protein
MRVREKGVAELWILCKTASPALTMTAIWVDAQRAAALQSPEIQPG